ELRLQAVDQWIQISETDLSICVAQCRGIAPCDGRETGLQIEIVKICVDRGLSVVVVQLTLIQHHVTNTQVEYIRGLCFQFRQTCLPVLPDKQMSHRMI